MQDSDLVAARVADVKMWERDGRRFHAIVLEAADGRLMAINVAPGEAAATALILTNTETSRPLTFPFVGALLRAASVELERVVVHALVDEVFLARAHVAPGRVVDARPSDALPLALVFGAPVFVARDVLDAAAFSPTLLNHPSLQGDAAAVAETALRRYRGPGVPVPRREEARSLLTQREEQVLRLVAAGYTNAEASRALGLSYHTVSRHLHNVYTKLGVSRRAQAVGYLRPLAHA